jgi:Kef-type K+ transport system membrane component KefB
MNSHLPTVITSSLASLLVAFALLWLCKHLAKSDSQALAYNILVCIFGGLIGWVLGALATPFDTTESDKFFLFGKAAAVFLSGYVVSKLDRFLEVALFSSDAKDTASWSRMALFVCSCLVVAIFVFTVRDYLNFETRAALKLTPPTTAVERDAAPTGIRPPAPRPLP